MNFEDHLANDVDLFWGDEIPEGYVDLDSVPNHDACADLLKDAVMAALLHRDVKAFTASLDDVIDEYNNHGYQIPKLSGEVNLEWFANLTRCYANKNKEIK